jgi:hypothetical protein
MQAIESEMLSLIFISLGSDIHPIGFWSKNLSGDNLIGLYEQSQTWNHENNRGGELANISYGFSMYQLERVGQEFNLVFHQVGVLVPCIGLVCFTFLSLLPIDFWEIQKLSASET